MSIDAFQEKIRKTKNPSVLVIEAFSEWIPPHILQESDSVAGACLRYYTELLNSLKGLVPGVRFGFGSFGLLGVDGLGVLSKLMNAAKELGFYVLLDAPEQLSVQTAKNTAQILAAADSPYPCDGVLFSFWLGSDILKALLPLAQKGKTLFPVVRTANKSAAEIQDLLTGARLVHTAAADIVSRQGENIFGKNGYSRICAVVSAGAPNSIRSIRSGYKYTYMLIDGLEYPSGNHKNCSLAFDRFGYGAVVCAGPSITAAWKEKGTDGTDFVAQAAEAADRMKKNILRYVTIL